MVSVLVPLVEPLHFQVRSLAVLSVGPLLLVVSAQNLLASVYMRLRRRFGLRLEDVGF